MPVKSSPKWSHSNVYTAQSACEYCEGVVRHEPWCIMVNPCVSYAYEAALDADKLTLTDQLILHALGVAWIGKLCAGKCAPSAP